MLFELDDQRQTLREITTIGLTDFGGAENTSVSTVVDTRASQ
jgi:hypothetical protein